MLSIAFHTKCSDLNKFPLSTFNLYAEELDCAHQCSSLQELSGDCNAYTFDKAQEICSMASLPFLEDPANGEIAQVRQIINNKLNIFGNALFVDIDICIIILCHIGSNVRYVSKQQS